MNGEVIRCVDREMEDKRLILGELSENPVLRGLKTCLNYVTKLSADRMLTYYSLLCYQGDCTS